MKQFPNLSEETINKLSTIEGMKNRKEIIGSLSAEELNRNINPLELLSDGKKEISSMSKNETTEMDKLINNTLNLDSEKVTEPLQEKFPDFKFEVDSYSKKFMKAMEAEINSGKTTEEKEAIKKQIQEVDLLEIQNTGGTSDIKQIRNVIRENYTHNSLLKEIKNKASENSLNQVKSFDNTSSSTEQISSTMDLFE